MSPIYLSPESRVCQLIIIDSEMWITHEILIWKWIKTISSNNYLNQKLESSIMWTL